MTCWSCQADLEPASESCPRCGKLQPPRSGDYFAYLGLPRSYHVDTERLGEILRDRSRKLHPDRFAKAEAKERALSLQHTTLLNDAVRTLRDPQKRAEYLLSLHGLKAGGQERVHAKVDEGFLMEMLETREALAEAKAAQDAATLAKLSSQARAEKEKLLSEADAKFTAWEKSQDQKPLQEVVSLLDRVRYFDQIVAEAAGQPVH